MTDQEKIRELQLQVATLQRERDTAVGAINMYRLTLQLTYKHVDAPPLMQSAILSDLKSHLNGPLVDKLKEIAKERGEPDSFDVPIIEQRTAAVDPDVMWEKFIRYYALKYGHVTKPPKDPKKAKGFVPVTTMKNFIGSIDKYKRAFLEAQTGVSPTAHT